MRRRGDSVDRATNPHRCRSAAERFRDLCCISSRAGSGERVRVALTVRRSDEYPPIERTAPTASPGAHRCRRPRSSTTDPGSAVPGRASTSVRARDHRAARGSRHVRISIIVRGRRRPGGEQASRRVTDPRPVRRRRRRSGVPTDGSHRPRRSPRVAQLGPGRDRPVDGLDGRASWPSSEITWTRRHARLPSLADPSPGRRGRRPSHEPSDRAQRLGDRDGFTSESSADLADDTVGEKEPIDRPNHAGSIGGRRRSHVPDPTIAALRRSRRGGVPSSAEIANRSSGDRRRGPSRGARRAAGPGATSQVSRETVLHRRRRGRARFRRRT